MFFIKKKDKTTSAKPESRTATQGAQSTEDGVKKETDQERKKYFGLDPIALARIQLFKLLAGRR